MKTPKVLETVEMEYDSLDMDELTEFKSLNDDQIDHYYDDYNQYEQDLTQLIRSKK